jgi:hypothetical protein
MSGDTMTRMTRDEEDRKRARATWPVVRVSLHAKSCDENLFASTTVEERLSMMWPLAKAAWSLAGGIPDYPRSEAPIRVSRRG